MVSPTPFMESCERTGPKLSSWGPPSLAHPHHGWPRGRPQGEARRGFLATGARAGAISWWVGVSSLVWMGGEEDPRPVGDEVAGVSTPPQGQYDLIQVFHWEHFLKEIIVFKKRQGQDVCRKEQVRIYRARRYQRKQLTAAPAEQGRKVVGVS